jgi:hypothetical protein
MFKQHIDAAQLEESASYVIQFDFAEKFTCEEQDQPQAAHFGTTKLSIFTISSWHRGFYKSRAIVSDILLQDKNLIASFLDRIFCDLPESAKQSMCGAIMQCLNSKTNSWLIS